MESLSERRRKQVENYDGPIFNNEWSMFSRICTKHFPDEKRNIWDRNYERHKTKGKVLYEFQEKGDRYAGSETYEELSSGSVSILREDKGSRGSISYRIAVGGKVGFIEIARVTRENGKTECNFPVFEEDERMRVNGQLPKDKIKATVFETIEDTIKTHPILSQYKDMILDDLNAILSLDPEKGEVKQLTAEQLKIVSVQAEIEEPDRILSEKDDKNITQKEDDESTK